MHKKKLTWDDLVSPRNGRHGAGLEMHAYALENDFTIIAPDQRGHGESRTPTGTAPLGFHASDYANDAHDVIHRFSPNEPVLCVGHSMGARTAIALYRSHWNHLRGLVLIDMPIAPQDDGSAAHRLRSFLEKIPDFFVSREEMKTYLTTHCPDPSMAQYLIAVAQPGEAPGQIRFPYDRDALLATIDAASIDKPSFMPMLEKTANEHPIPISILRGANSLVWLKESYEKDQAALSHLNCIKFEEWENTTHGLPFERREDFVNHLRHFF